ncbi:MAG: CBS domain-containing protein [Lachnospiraceae bacterium]|nr:CBS domain-containing protein [Lachnospiraceae bacterium]
MKLDKYCVTSEVSILEAMKKINNNAKGIIYITEKGKAIGVVTDGDIRRYILSKGDLENSIHVIMNKSFIWLPRGKEESAQATMVEKGISSLPVLDENHQIIRLYFRNERVKEEKSKLNIPVVIMAGGEGTRLHPYTQILPKPLIPIGNSTITEHIMERFSEYGCNDFTMIVNYKKNFIKSYFLDYDCKYNVSFVDEEKFLGTGGGLKLLELKYGSTFFMTNCDILVEGDYSQILDYHKKNNNLITMVCAVKNVMIPYGTVEVNEEGKVTGLKEKPKMSFITNTGMYVLEPEFIHRIPENTFIHITDLIQQCIDEGENVGVYKIDEENWMDMGQLEELEKMKRKLNVE